MKIYIAARYSRVEEMREVRQALSDLGHETIARWLNQDRPADDSVSRGQTEEQREDAAIGILEDVAKCDAVVSFTELFPKAKVKPQRGGRHAEFGLGVALNKRMFIVGPREHALHWLPQVERFDTLEEFLDSLEHE